ncbi:MAG: hypothetical protein OIF50_06440 [Flavobacteriaceae bacterium]|nr:hypothetical protein [Flavobacteriaceae bacterium]
MKKLYLMIGFCLMVIHSHNAQQKPIVLKGKQLFGALQARQIGPALMSGRITDLETHPTNSRILYAGTAGGGVWKTNDGGATFNSIFDDYCQSIGTIAIDPNDPDNTVWVGTGETWTRNSTSVGDGLYRTKDGGQTWNKIGFEHSDRIASIQINPKNSNEIYIGVLGALWGDSEERGVYKTIDAGKTWNKILYVDQTTGCSDLVMDPNNSNILYAAFWEFRRTGWSFNSGGDHSALYKSTDGGKTWNKIHNGFPKGKLGRFAFAVAPSNSNILYAVVESKKDSDKGLYRSDDAGKSWKHLNNDFELVVRPFYFSRITIDPRNPDVVVKGGLSGSISRDGGKTFKNLGSMHSDIHDIAFDIKDSDRMYAATDGGVYRSWNGGTTMEIVSNMPVSQFYHVTVDNQEPYNIYGGLQDNGSWYGPSSSPGGIEARDWNSVGAGDGFRVYPHPTKKILYSEMQGAENVWRYDMERHTTKTIQPLATKGDPKLRFNWNPPMTTSKHQPDRLYMGTQFVHISNDMGNTWTKISPDLTTNDPKKQQQDQSGGLSKDNSGAENHCTIFTITESPLNEKVIWVGTDDGNVQITKDGGKTWTNTVTNIPDLPANTWCYHIEASVHNEGTAYAVFDGHTTNDKNAYAYKTTDYGKTWKSIISDDVKSFTRSIQEDYVNENLLFLGTEMGLYITIDGGKNWSKFTNNMPSTAVHHLTLQEKTNDLVMATHGRGVIILDDISPLRALNQEILNKNVYFFDNKPMEMKESSGFGGGSTELQFVGPNKSSNGKIVYYLKKRHTFGKMTMHIEDENGKKVIDLNPGKSKGINIVNWSFVRPIPKMAKAKTLSFDGFTAPKVAAGKYTVVLTKGKKTYTHPIEVIYDKKSTLNTSDRQKKNEITMKLYDMVEDLAYMVHELDANIAYAEKLEQSHKKSSKMAKAVIQKLSTLKKSLVITSGDNYVGSAEPELREKMAQIYSKVASSHEVPSFTDMENIRLIENRFNNSKIAYSKIINKEFAKLTKWANKNQIAPNEVITKKSFLKK